MTRDIFMLGFMLLVRALVCCTVYRNRGSITADFRPDCAKLFKIIQYNSAFDLTTDLEDDAIEFKAVSE